MATSHVVKEAIKREVDSNKKKEVAYVRAEKAADEAAQRRLVEAYGDSRRIGGDSGRRSRAWKCSECGFNNYESRMACGDCLAPNKTMARISTTKNEARPGQSLDPTAKVIRAGGRSYRTFDGPTPLSASAAAPAPAGRTAAAADGEDEEEEIEEGEQIVFDSVAKCYELRMAVPRRFFKFLIGSNGAALQETQRITGATVIIPKSPEQQQQDGGKASASPPVATSGATPSMVGSDGLADEEVVKIRADSVAAVRAAQLRIDATMVQCKDMVDYTHFLSIPIGTIPSANTKLTTFLSDMQSACCDEEKKIDPSLFQKPQKIHLTLLMLRLHTKAEVDAAQAVLESFQSVIDQIFAPSDSVVLRGLNYMNDDPTEVHVVYLELERDSTYTKLSALISQINQAFIHAGIALGKDVAHNEKLHATVINSKWRDQRDAAAAGKPKLRVPFDATNIFKMFGKVHLGGHRLVRLEMNVVGPLTGMDGYYPREAAINFP